LYSESTCTVVLGLLVLGRSTLDLPPRVTLNEGAKPHLIRVAYTSTSCKPLAFFDIILLSQELISPHLTFIRPSLS